uniref:Putative Bis(5'-adenosyl)-triphosphatase n=1 Tax=Trypanosoma congolense (strain IL3000) TaxID=1068625 RepID=G0URQ9_TRYCI|nr:putative Bis(5'-adenosyl)-triphosphatase [Trypanosoma congolense IL3000]
MRSAQLPPKLSLSSGSCSHWVVAATNCSESYRSFCSCIEKMACDGSSLPRHVRFRVDHLLPGDWSLLLRQCRRLTTAGGSFNYSYPGDLLAASDCPKVNDAAGNAPVVVNAAFMHVVERTSGDFVPNNMVYHKLQNHCIVRNPTKGLSDNGEEDFTSFLSILQQDPCVDRLEPVAVDGIEAVSDKLMDDAQAVAASKHNRRLFLQDAVTFESNETGGESKCVFFFFPHRVMALDTIPYNSEHFVVMVNHKPIVAGHLMVIPIRCVGTLAALSEAELKDLGYVIHLTICVLKHLSANMLSNRVEGSCNAACSNSSYGDITHSFNPFTSFGAADEGGFSVAVQQGELAGQTVPHLHVHIIPFDPRGELAGEPEDEEMQRKRSPRTAEQMREETELLRPYFKLLASTIRERT